MPGLPLVTMDDEEPKLPSLPLEKPASQNLITDFFRQPKKTGTLISKESKNSSGNWETQPEKKLLSTAKANIIHMDTSLDDFEEEETHKKETKLKSKKLKKGKNGVGVLQRTTETKKRETAPEQLEISYEDFLRSVRPDEDSVIVLDEPETQGLSTSPSGPKVGDGDGDGVQEKASVRNGCKESQDMEVDSQNYSSTEALSNGDVNGSDSVMCEPACHPSQASTRMVTAEATKIASSKKMLDFTENGGGLGGEGKTADEVGDCIESLVSPSAKAKTKSKGIEMFFTKTSKKYQGKKEDDSVTITVTAEVYSEPEGLSQERCNSGTRSVPGQESSPGGRSQKRRSNVAVNDCDLTITHLDTTIVNLPDKKNKVENKNTSDVTKPGLKDAAEDDHDSCIITCEKVAMDTCKGPDEITEKALTEEEVKQHEEDLKKKEERRKQAAAQMATLDKVKVKVSNRSRQGTLGFGNQGLTTVKPSKAAVLDKPHPAPLTESQPEVDENCGEKLEQSTNASNITTTSSNSCSKSKKSGTKGEKKDEQSSKGKRKTAVVKQPLTSTPKVKGKRTDECNVMPKKAQPKVCRRKRRQAVVSDGEGDVLLSESDEQTQVSASEGNVDVFKSAFLGVSPGSSKSRKAPIKMRFTRLRYQKSLASEDDPAVLTEMKSKQQKVTRAQQLIQKAKTGGNKKQGKKGAKPSVAAKGAAVKGTRKKKKVNVEDESPGLRRSLRSCAMTAKAAISVSFEEKVRTKRKQLIESDDSDIEVVKLETPTKRKKMKESKVGKKPTPKKKGAPQLASIFQKKSTAGVEAHGVTDDAIPVDPELLKVRRQFLMSGVPQELRKQKVAADMATNNYEYPPIPEVSHVQQRPPAGEHRTDSRGVADPWNLPKVDLAFRETPDEVCVNDANFSKLKRLPDVGPKLRMDGSKQRSEIPAEVRPYLLAEINLHNPAYPVRRIFRQLTKRDEGKDNSQKEEGAGEKDPKDATTTGVEDASKGRKRKLPETEGDTKSEESSRHSKRRRGARQDAAGSQLPPVRRSSRVSTRRQSYDDCQIIVGEIPEVFAKSNSGEECIDDTSSGNTRDITPPECQWSEKYQPRSGAEVLGNQNCVKKMKAWLIEWIQRTDLEIRRVRKQILKQARHAGKSKEETKKEISKQLGSEWMMDDDSDFDLGSSEEDSDYEECDSLLCNTMVVSGTHGVGKTAMVYALAQELGYKVFEVNASNRRNGKQILAQLQEATQSHQVSKKNMDSMFTSSMAVENSKKASTPKVTQKPEKKLPTAFANLFQKDNGGSQSNTNQKSQTVSGKLSSHGPKRAGGKKSAGLNGDMSSPAGKVCRQPATPAKDEGSNSRKGLNLSSTSLILFEEVDIVFEEDKGFWAAIQTFMSLTKRPIILTTSDPKVASTVQGRHEHLCMKIPPVVNIASHMQVVCLAENVRTDFRDLLSLVNLYKGNIRQCLLALQFWILSGGGICQEDVPIKYHPNFFSSKKDVVAGVTPVKPASPRSGLRESLRPLQPRLLLDATRDSSDEFESDSPKPRRGHRGRPVIEDDSSMDSVGGTPTKLGVGRLLSTQEEDSQEGLMVATPAAGGEEELLQAEVAVTPPLHTMCFESLTSAGDGQQSFFTLLKKCGTSADASCIEDFLTENSEVVYSNLLRLLSLPYTEAVRRPACLLTNSVRSQPVQRKRIRIATELFGGNDSDDETFVSLPGRQESECPDKCLSPSASNDKVSTPEDDSRPKPSSEISDEDRILLKSVKSLSDMYDQFSALDAYLLRPCGDREGCCGRNAHVWSAGRLVPGLSSQGDRCDDHHSRNHWLGSAVATHVQLGSVAKANHELQTSLDTMHQLNSADTLQDKMSLPVEGRHRLDLRFTQETSLHTRLGASHQNCLEYVSLALPSHVQCQKRAIAMDYMPSLRTICRSEQLRRVTNTKRRFLHYMDYISLPVMRKQSVINTLCSSFT